MKEIKAFIHRNRVADVLHALKNNGFCSKSCNLSINNVNGTLQAIDDKEHVFSMELGEGIISEVKLELICKDELVQTAVKLIRDNSHTGQSLSGWIFTTDILDALPIHD